MDMAAIQNLCAAEALRMERIEKLYEKSEKLIRSSNMAGYNKNDIIGKNFLLKFWSIWNLMGIPHARQS